VSNLLKRCLNIADLNKRARRSLPSPIYGYLERGADDEYSLQNNTAAFDHYQLQPRSLNDVSNINMQTRVLGCDIDWPVILSPTGMTRMFHPGGELPPVRRTSLVLSIRLRPFLPLTWKRLLRPPKPPRCFRSMCSPTTG